MTRGTTRVEMSRPNPTGEEGWVSDKTWASILQVSEEFEGFKGLEINFEKNLDEWERIYNLQKPQSKKANWPAPLDMEKCLDDSNKKVAMVIVLSAVTGAKVNAISLGQG